MRREERIIRFVDTIWQWYAVHKRDLPWRDLWHLSEEDRAYRVLVSEVMLQQTQVERVKIVFKDFLSRFPHLADLARASNRDVLMAWRGMGYNNRALRLRNAAASIADDHNGIFPRDMDALQKLSGVGHYTAAAIRNFAFSLPTPCIDTNIRRVLHRTFIGCENMDGTWKKDDRYLLKLAEEILEVVVCGKQKLEIRKQGTGNREWETGNQYSPAGLRPTGREQGISLRLRGYGRQAGNGDQIPSSKFQLPLTADWHAALMDYGSLVQTKMNPKWEMCPLSEKGIMRASKRDIRGKRDKRDIRERNEKREPGRFVGSSFVPNRIFRGKVVEELRDAPKGLFLCEIGKRICVDWDPNEHEEWLKKIISSLEKDDIVRARKERLVLA